MLRKRDLPGDLEFLQAIPGEPDDFLQRGGSAVICPDGAYLAGPVGEGEAIIVAEVDPARIIEERLALEVTGHYHRPDFFQCRVG